MGSMKSAYNRLAKENMRASKEHRDLEDIIFAAKQEYYNTPVQATNAEMHAFKEVLMNFYDRMDAQDRRISELEMQNHRLESLLYRGVGMGTIKISEETTTKTTTVEITGKEPKWTKEKIFRAFDHYRRDHGLFSNINPDIVRRNWSTLFTQTPKYTGMTLGSLLKEYADERGLNY
jgi:hypothetical protein